MLDSSFQLVYSNNFQEKLDFFKQKFDYIIIDTPPLLSVSDTLVLMSKADLNLLVARHNLTKLNEIKQSIAISEQTGSPFSGVIYNAYEKPSSYYGYYGYYGNYDYQYYAKNYLYSSYDYNKDKNE